jgi:DNA-binding GntR family transcriptional regulator
MLGRNVDAVFSAMRLLSRNGIVLASYEQISAKSNIPRRTVARAINELIKRGNINRTHAKGRGITNIYSITKERPHD